MRAIVTGGAGFIGCHVARALLARDHRVLVLDDLSGGFESNIPKGAEFERWSVTDELDSLFQRFKPDAVYHLAAYAAEGLSHHIPVFNYTNNLVGTANVLGAGYRAGITHFVFTSSIAVFGHGQFKPIFSEEDECIPCDPYGVAKLACENHIRVFHDYYHRPSYTIFRPHNVFGPNQNISDPYRNVVGIFMKKAMASEPLPVFGDGSQTRSFSYITSVAECIAQAPCVPAAKDQLFNVGGDEPMSVKDLAGHVSRILGKKENLQFLPARHEVAHAHADHSRVRSAFPEAFAGSPDIVEGLRLMVEWVKSNPAPAVTECPSRIEIMDQLPPSWAARV
ncbi:MAG: NAD-dependent epimerase/dehydratase family protein [Acidobacteriaceae bacterium]